MEGEIESQFDVVFIERSFNCITISAAVRLAVEESVTY